MHEKYHANRMGERGEGGEYVPQEGFGWSNGVILELLAEFPLACQGGIDTSTDSSH